MPFNEKVKIDKKKKWFQAKRNISIHICMNFQLDIEQVERR